MTDIVEEMLSIQAMGMRRHAWKEQISRLFDIPMNNIMEVCVTEANQIIFNVLGEDSFVVTLEGKNIIKSSLRYK